MRLHGQVELDLAGSGLPARALANVFWAGVVDAAKRHLAIDELDAPARLPESGLVTATTPACVRRRAESPCADPPLLTVVTSSRERPGHLRMCLAQLLVWSHPASRFSIVVVDNDPTTGRAAALGRGEYRWGCYAREGGRGSTSARNVGTALTDTEHEVLTDDDAIGDKHWLALLGRAVRPRERTRNFGTAVARALRWLHPWSRPPLVRSGSESRRYPALPAQRGRVRDWQQRELSSTGTALRDIGRSDSALGNVNPALGGADSGALLRTVLSGQTTVYELTAIVWHVHRPDDEGLSRQVYRRAAGLTTYLVEVLLHRPGLIGDFSMLVPRGVAFAVSPASTKNHGKPADYPRLLTRLGPRGCSTVRSPTLEAVDATVAIRCRPGVPGAC